MSEQESKTGAGLDVSKTLESISGLPSPLQSDPKRQAVASIRGDIYQAWCSIDAWLCLRSADEVIYLEGAEDFDVVKGDGAQAVQVKHHVGSISLGNAKAHEALENYWLLCTKAPDRNVNFHYLTTSTTAKEKDDDFEGLKGIDAWRIAQTSIEFAEKVAAYLASKLNNNSALRKFLETATTDTIQNDLIQRFHWLVDQPDLEDVKRSVEDRIIVLLNDQRRAVSLSSTVLTNLESRFWEIFLQESLSQRRLTRAELLRLVEEATTTHFVVPTDRLPELLAPRPPEAVLFNVLLGKTPAVPHPLLRRQKLIERVEELVRHRKHVLLVGTVYKGKTTLAQLVASALCTDTWWFNFNGRKIDQVVSTLVVLANRIESGDCPSVVVIDDLDVSVTAQGGYRDSLRMVLHRADVTGRGLIITARGDSSDFGVADFFNKIAVLDVPEVGADETEELCVEQGCPEEFARIWAVIVHAGTMGHPKLIQVRLAELASQGWPRPYGKEIAKPSPAITSSRKLARTLLSESVPESWSEFVYLLAECWVIVQRQTAIRIAEAVRGIRNAGDVLDNLSGKWIERLEGDWYRVTPLLKGVASEVWSEERIRQAHIHLHDAIYAKINLSTYEAAALLYHAFMGKDSPRLASCARAIYSIKEDELELEVYRQLAWFPYVALDPGQRIANEPMTGSMLRSVQFRIASILDTDCLAKICARWDDEIEMIPHAEPKSLMRAMSWMSIASAESSALPISLRLSAIVGFSGLPNGIREQVDASHRKVAAVNVAIGLPSQASVAQVFFLVTTRSVRDLDSIKELLRWLDEVADENMRREFDAILEWPLVQTLGAFVHGAWVTKHQETEDWRPWLELFSRIDDYAKCHNSLCFGREAAKAAATILTDFMGKPSEALKVLDQAEATFGASAVLTEQRVNVLFQTKDDKAALEIWERLSSNPENRFALDPFAYRRVGISASRLGLWSEASRIFHSAANLDDAGQSELLRFGLRVDEALVESLGGNFARAANVLAEAVLLQPQEAEKDGVPRWEAAQRAAVAVCTSIENQVWKNADFDTRLAPGFASSPDLTVEKPQLGQPARTEISRVQILRLASVLSNDVPAVDQALESLVKSEYPFVRWLAKEARLAHAYTTGAGTGFIEALIAFDKSISDILTRPKTPKWLTTREVDTESSTRSSAERWIGMLTAGIICADPVLEPNFEQWLVESTQILGKDSELTKQIARICITASKSRESLPRILTETENHPLIRCVAATRLLSERTAAKDTLLFQKFLASALVGDESYNRQELFNHHVAIRFADPWRVHAQNRFQFCAPRSTVPLLLLAIEDVVRGKGTLRNLLTASANALGQPLGEFQERLI